MLIICLALIDLCLPSGLCFLLHGNRDKYKFTVAAEQCICTVRVE